MYLECVVVCIHYSDFLSHTLALNKSHFNRMVVVTDDTDSDTKAVCDLHDVHCFQSSELYTDDSNVPNKGKAINIGLAALSKTGWVLQLDADIYLPPLTRYILEKLPLNEKTLYGIDRLMCNSYEDWNRYMHQQRKPLHEGWIYLHTDIFPIGTRLVQYHAGGYQPIGFFQLWHPQASNVYSYPEHQSG